MCWSILRVTGIYDRQRTAEEAELNKKAPLSEEAKKDPAQLAARALEIEQNTFNKLKPNVGAFVNVYGAGTGTTSRRLLCDRRSGFVCRERRRVHVMGFAIRRECHRASDRASRSEAGCSGSLPHHLRTHADRSRSELGVRVPRRSSAGPSSRSSRTRLGHADIC